MNVTIQRSELLNSEFIINFGSFGHYKLASIHSLYHFEWSVLDRNWHQENHYSSREFKILPLSVKNVANTLRESQIWAVSLKSVKDVNSNNLVLNNIS